MYYNSLKYGAPLYNVIKSASGILLLTPAQSNRMPNAPTWWIPTCLCAFVLVCRLRDSWAPGIAFSCYIIEGLAWYFQPSRNAQLTQGHQGTMERTLGFWHLPNLETDLALPLTEWVVDKLLISLILFPLFKLEIMMLSSSEDGCKN